MLIVGAAAGYSLLPILHPLDRAAQMEAMFRRDLPIVVAGGLGS